MVQDGSETIMEPREVSDSMIESGYLEQAKLTQVSAWLGLCSSSPTPSQKARVEAKELLVRIDGKIQQPDLTAIDIIRNGRMFEALRLAVDKDDVAIHCVLDFPEEPGRYYFTDIRFSFNQTDGLLPPIRAVDFNRREPASAIPETGIDLTGIRLLSSNYRWHTLVEDPDRKSESFKELIGPAFRMEFGYGSVNSFDELDAWINGSASSVRAARHDLEMFSWRAVRENKYEAEFVLNWLGLTHEDKRMSAKTHHTWLLTDIRDRHYPTIDHINVAFIEPFRVTG